MKAGILSLVIVFMSTFSTEGQVIRTVKKLPAVLNENSGIVVTQNGQFYFINDGGNPSSVYLLDTFDVSVHEFPLAGASNKDFEDLTSDNMGNLFIGDFGNNDNNRTDLAIYKTQIPSSISIDSLHVDTISFNYQNQTGFPPTASRLNFDCEAFIWFEDSLYLFSKNRTNPYSGLCYMYVLPDQPGDYVARLVDSIQLTAQTKELDWITSADVRNDTLVLLASNAIYELDGFGTNSFSSLDAVKHGIGLSQKESISFHPSARSYFCSDEFNIFGGNLYQVTFAPSAVDEQTLKALTFSDGIYTSSHPQNTAFYVLNSLGSLILKKELKYQESVDLNVLNAGSYILIIDEGTRRRQIKWVKTD